MKQSLFLLSIFYGALCVQSNAQLDLSDLDFYVGSGTDTTMMVIDFKDASFDSSYAWGYIYSGSKTGEDMIYDINLADINLDVNIDTASFGNYVQDITYGIHEGIGGQPDYWSSWDGSSMDSLVSNLGIATPLIPGGVFGFSYTDFNPAIEPGTPIRAYDPMALTFNMVDTWVGSGMDSTIFIIDFNDSTDTTSFVWGYLFDDSVSYITVLNDLEAFDASLSINYGGGSSVIDITYKGLFATASAVQDWHVWEAENFGNWRPRYADPIYLHPGDMGALVHTKFLKVTRPSLPNNLNQQISTREYIASSFSMYPNPTAGIINIEGDFKEFAIYSLSGALLKSSKEHVIDISQWQKGVYIIIIEDNSGNYITQRIIKE